MPRDPGENRDASGSAPAPTKRSVSCHICRLRKAKCVKETGSERCNSCISLDRECEPPRSRRRPGPISRYSREAMSGADHSLSGGSQTSRLPDPSLLSPRSALSTEWASASASTDSASTLSVPPAQPSHVPIPATIPRSAWEAHCQFDTGEGLGGGRATGGSVGVCDLAQTPALLTSRGSHSHRHPTRIEDVMPRDMAVRILHAYHDYLYPLMPAVHWPTFVQQLMSREDERNRLWLAFIFSLLAYSIVQLPRPCLDFVSIEELVHFHQGCYSASHSLQNRSFVVISSVDIACQHIYLASLFKKNLANVTLAKAIRLSQELNLHCNDTSVDFIEAELRRRIFWLLYGSDRTICVMDDTPMMLWDWDMAVPYPQPVDDEYITKAGSFPQPLGRTSTLAGFLFVSRIFHLLGVVLSALRARRSPHDNRDIAELLSLPRYVPSGQYTATLYAILADLPPELELRADAPENSHPAFAICRVNILITQAMTRQAIQQYAAAIGEDGIDADAARHRKLVIDMLEAMPQDSLNANGDSLRMKILYFVLSGMGSDDDSPMYNAEFLDMYMRLRARQQAHILHEAPNISDDSGTQTPTAAPAERPKAHRPA